MSDEQITACTADEIVEPPVLTPEEHEEQRADEQQARLLAIVEIVSEGQSISNDEALFLLSLIAGLEHSSSVSQLAMQILGTNTAKMFTQLGLDCMRRVGRNDMKTKRSMGKISDQYITSLFMLSQQELAARLEGRRVGAETATTPDTPSEPTQEDIDRASQERSDALLAALNLDSEDLVGSNPDEVA